MSCSSQTNGLYNSNIQSYSNTAVNQCCQTDGCNLASHLISNKLNLFCSLDAAKYEITVGGYSVSTPDSWTLTDLDVSKVISHPNYDETTFKNDLALFKLAVSTF